MAFRKAKKRNYSLKSKQLLPFGLARLAASFHKRRKYLTDLYKNQSHRAFFKKINIMRYCEREQIDYVCGLNRYEEDKLLLKSSS